MRERPLLIRRLLTNHKGLTMNDSLFLDGSNQLLAEWLQSRITSSRRNLDLDLVF